ncbi:MAG: hypothetical protein LUH14_05935 [Clostridiaceae bacterium]|nr:hypothetical protein [Clostridiaceae bacterium]
MITQSQLKLWIPEATEIFKRYMPPTTLPPIYIGAPRNILKLRAELVVKTQSHQVNHPDPYDSVMEMIHGDAGDAILIQQKLVYTGRGAEDHFYHCLWHELGHYFAIKYECDDLDEHGSSALHRYNDPGLQGDLLSTDRYKQEGYWFWSEYIAESIANYVEEQHCRIDNADCYHPEQLTWEPKQWGFIPDRLQDFLEMTLTYYPSTIDEAALAMYFASLLMSDAIKRYVVAADEGKLKVYDNEAIGKGKLGATKLMEPGSIEPTCISDMPDCYQDTMWDMKALLERQLKKKEFWKIDETFLEEIGGCISLLMMDKMLMMRLDEE